MKLTFESNSSTGRFAVLDESVSRHLLFETYHLNADERATLQRAFKHVEDAAYQQGKVAALTYSPKGAT